MTGLQRYYWIFFTCMMRRFTHSQMALMWNKWILQVKNGTKSLCKLVQVIKKTVDFLQQRNNENFVSLMVKKARKSEDDEQARQNFVKMWLNFMKHLCHLIRKWSQHLADFSALLWMTLDNVPHCSPASVNWKVIETWFNAKGINVDDNTLDFFSNNVEKELKWKNPGSCPGRLNWPMSIGVWYWATVVT